MLYFVAFRCQRLKYHEKSWMRNMGWRLFADIGLKEFSLSNTFRNPTICLSVVFTTLGNARHVKRMLGPNKFGGLRLYVSKLRSSGSKNVTGGDGHVPSNLPFRCLDGFRQIGPGTVGPRTVGSWTPVVRGVFDRPTELVCISAINLLRRRW